MSAAKKVKVLVNRSFRDKRNKRLVREKGTVIEVTEARLAEINGTDPTLVSVVQQ